MLDRPGFLLWPSQLPIYCAGLLAAASAAAAVASLLFFVAAAEAAVASLLFVAAAEESLKNLSSMEESLLVLALLLSADADTRRPCFQEEEEAVALAQVQLVEEVVALAPPVLKLSVFSWMLRLAVVDFPALLLFSRWLEAVQVVELVYVSPIQHEHRLQDIRASFVEQTRQQTFQQTFQQTWQQILVLAATTQNSLATHQEPLALQQPLALQMKTETC